MPGGINLGIGIAGWGFGGVSYRNYPHDFVYAIWQPTMIFFLRGGKGCADFANQSHG